MMPRRRTCCEGRRNPWRRASAAWAAQPAEAPGRPLLSLSLTLPAPAAGRAPQARRRGVPLGFIGSACIMIGFFMTFAAMAEGRENLAGPFIFLMIVGGLIGRIAKSRR